MWMTLLILFGIALLASSIGYKKYVWFISIGYGLSIAAIGAYLTYLNADDGITAILSTAIMIVYGIRLSGYITYREVKTTYNKKMKGEISDGKNMKFGVKFAIWVTVAFQYVCMTAPAYFVKYNSLSHHKFSLICTGISIFGLVFESIADMQKQTAKKDNPYRFVDTGLFRFVRCPNYLGEMIFWTGIFCSGIPYYSGFVQWAVAVTGYLMITYTMFSGARRLEVRQNKTYGNDEEYKKYHDSVPIMIPFIPLYTVERHTWLRA